MAREDSTAKRKGGLGVTDLVMLGFGSIIGAGLFVASGVAVKAAGPAVLLAFLIGGAGVWGVLSAMAEMAANNPSPGGLRTFARQALGPWMGFTVGWMYWTSGVLTMSSEVTAAALLTHIWLPHVPLWLLSLAYSVLITGVNFMDVRGFGKIESGLSVIKVVALVGFVLLGGYFLLRLRGAAPGLAFIRSSHTGLFPTGLRGLWGAMLMVVFSYAGVQVVAMAAPETRDPERTIPLGIKSMAGGLVTLYLLAFAVLVALLPWQKAAPQVSPFVQAMSGVGVGWADAVLTFVIITAALSALNSSLYSVSRMLFALAQKGEAPALFLRENRYNVPVWAVASSSLVLGLAIALAYFLPHGVYLLITSASGTIAMFNWSVLCLCHIRYRRTLQKLHPEGLVYKAWGYPWYSWLTMAFALSILLTAPFQPGQSAGVFVFLGMVSLISLVYLSAIRPRRQAAAALRVAQRAAPGAPPQPAPAVQESPVIPGPVPAFAFETADEMLRRQEAITADPPLAVIGSDTLGPVAIYPAPNEKAPSP
ncbi:MAG: amino acid permease [Mycobacterium leprae]